MIYEFSYFFNELDLLEAKLDASKDKVDKVVIIESDTDLLHRPKPLYFWENRDRFSDHLHRIIHITPTDSSMEKTGYALFRERIAHVPLAFSKCKPNDILIITDPDVVLRPSTYEYIEAINMEKSETVVSTDWYCYYMDYHLNTMKHKHTNAYLYKNTKDDGWEVVHRWNPIGAVVEDGGWHFAKLGGVDALIENIKGYPHQELNTPEICNRETLQKKIDAGCAWDGPWPGEKIFDVIPYKSENYPEYINSNMSKYRKYFKEPPNGN